MALYLAVIFQMQSGTWWSQDLTLLDLKRANFMMPILIK